MAKQVLIKLMTCPQLFHVNSVLLWDHIGIHSFTQKVFDLFRRLEIRFGIVFMFPNYLELDSQEQACEPRLSC